MPNAFDEKEDSRTIHEGIALAEIVAYIKDTRSDTEHAPLFILADLVKIHTTRVEQLGTTLSNGRVNLTGLKERIFMHFPDLDAHREGRNVLVFNKDVGPAIRNACEHDAYSDAIDLARAANTIRRDIFNKKTSFTGIFDKECHESSVPSSSVALGSIILYGPNIQSQSNSSSPMQATLSI